MFKRILALCGALAALCLLPPSISAQAPAGFVRVYQGSLLDANGNAVNNATVCAQAMASGHPISVTVNGGTGSTVTRQVCAPISFGTWSMYLPDGSTSNPLNVAFQLVVTDNVSGDTIAQYSGVQPTSVADAWCSAAGCSLDMLTPDVPQATLTVRGQRGPTGPPGCAIGVTGSQGCTSDLTPKSLNGYQVHVQQYGGTSLDQQLLAAIAAWSTSPNPIVFIVDSPATLATAVTLRAGDALLFNASTTLNATITISDHGTVRCGTGVTLTVGQSVATAFTSTNASNVTLEGCTATTAKTGSQLDGSGFYFSTGGSNNAVRNNTVTGMWAGYFNGTNKVVVSGNSVTGNDAGRGYGVVVTGNGSQATVIGNHFTNVANGFQVFNADVDPNHGGPTTRAGIMALGSSYTATGNTCNTVKACIWFSGAHDITVSGNNANICSDVCFDAEGVIDAVFSNNTCKNGVNGCGTTFFFSQNVHFNSNDFSSDSGKLLVKVYNASNVAAFNTGLMVTNNRLHCENVPCFAFGGDAAGNPTFTGNVVTDGLVTWGLNASGGTYRGNTFRYTMASTYPALTPGAYAGFPSAVIEDNIFQSDVAQANALPALQIYATDFNSNVGFIIERNKFLGGFPVDIKLSSNGGNAPGLTATLLDNYESANNVVHSPAKGSDNIVEPRKFILNGGNWQQVFPGAATKACTTFPTVVNGLVTGC